VNRALTSKLSMRLGSRVQSSKAAAGGDINEAFEIELANGRKYFVKTQSAELPFFFDREAQGLAWLRQAQALRVPEVIFATDKDELGPACLVLELIVKGPHGADFDEQLGTGLAMLHRAGAAQFGLEHDNYLATLPQDNRATATWAEFYASRRIAPQLERAVRAGHANSTLAHRLERVLTRIKDLVGPEEPAARLHGDLWSGNAICDDRGAPVLIDPAVYGGHREMDLAMMRLFGGFSERVFAAYAASYPLAKGHAERVPLYQLYPLLVHVNLFGRSYVPQVERCISKWT
jgi:fructosamine-3-kinase